MIRMWKGKENSSKYILARDRVAETQGLKPDPMGMNSKVKPPKDGIGGVLGWVTFVKFDLWCTQL